MILNNKQTPDVSEIVAEMLRVLQLTLAHLKWIGQGLTKSSLWTPDEILKEIDAVIAKAEEVAR